MGRLIRASLLPGSILTGVPVLALPIEHGGRHFDVLLDMGGPRPGRVRVVAAGAKWPRRTLPEAEGLWRKATLDIQPLRGAKASAAARALLAAAEGALLTWGLYTRIVAEVADPSSDPSQRPTRPDLIVPREPG